MICTRSVVYSCYGIKSYFLWGQFVYRYSGSRLEFHIEHTIHNLLTSLVAGWDWLKQTKRKESKNTDFNSQFNRYLRQVLHVCLFLLWGWTAFVRRFSFYMWNDCFFFTDSFSCFSQYDEQIKYKSIHASEPVSFAFFYFPNWMLPQFRSTDLRKSQYNNSHFAFG